MNLLIINDCKGGSVLKHKLKLLVYVLILSMLNIYPCFTSIRAEAATSTDFTRISGADRYSTSLKIADKGWNTTSQYAVLATGEDFPDSLSAVPLAKKYSAPILLTTPASLPKEVESKIESLHIGKIFIIGGESAVSKAIEDELGSKEITCIRLAGTNRYETSLEIAKYLGSSDLAFLATGENFPDALSIASYAAYRQAPILLSSKDAVPEKVKDYILKNSINKVYVVGGSGVIGDAAVSSLPNVERLSGTDRYETNRKVLNKFSDDFTYETTYFATGKSFPDAICGTALAASTNSPIILSDPEPDSNTIKFIKSKRSLMKNKCVFGGSQAVPDYVLNRFFLNDDYITAQDYYSKIRLYSENDVNGFNILSQGLKCYPYDGALNAQILKMAPQLLNLSRQYQNNDNFDAAITGYNALLQSSAPACIKTEAAVCKLLSEEKIHVIDQYKAYPSFADSVTSGLKYYKDWNVKYSGDLKYEPLKDYFNFSSTREYHVSATTKFDGNGFPLVSWFNTFYYNPVAICPYALSQHGKYLQGENTKQNILGCADFIVDNINLDGSLRYPVEYYHYQSLNPGWTSSMAQGQALSLLGRAYMLSYDKKYIYAGNMILNYLLTPVLKGGVMDTLDSLDPPLKDYIFFQEYVTKPPSYTLNGFIYTLIGLYDWSSLPDGVNTQCSTLAREYFNKGLSSLKVILPYYEIGGFTSYDLMYITDKRQPTPSDFYHSVHIEQLDALYYITKDPFFSNIRDIWKSYVPQ